MNESISPAQRQLLNFISKFESRKNYNIVSGRYKGSVPKLLIHMTLKEVYALQYNMRASGSTAVGAYQFMEPTLKEVAGQMKLTGNETFTADLQDEMIIYRLNKLRGFDEFLSGNVDVKTFALNLAKEFASMPSPFTGKSYYDKDGINKSHVNIDDLLNELSAIKDMV